jgi:hypothetical protein
VRITDATHSKAKHLPAPLVISRTRVTVISIEWMVLSIFLTAFSTLPTAISVSRIARPSKLDLRSANLD